MKILIVDDEENIVSLIRHSVDWEEFGITEVYDAYHGESALNIIHEDMPDIILADIEMPVMDGLTMVEKLRAEGVWYPEIIFLTCHADFDYVQKALRFSVVDYLLKPFKKEELTAVLSKAVILHKRKQISANEKEPMRPDGQNYITRGFFSDLIRGMVGGNTRSLADFVSRQKIPLDPYQEMRVLVFSYNEEEGEQKLSGSELLFVLRNIIAEIMFADDLSEIASTDYVRKPNHFMISLMYEHDFDRKKVESMAGRLQEMVKRYVGTEVCCLISDPILLEKVSDTVKLAEEYYWKHRISGKPVYYCSEFVERVDAPDKEIDREVILKSLRNMKKTDLIVYMKNYLMGRRDELTPAVMEKLHHDLMQVFYGYLLENNLYTSELLKDDNLRSLNASAEYSATNMMKYVNYMFDRVVADVSSLRESGSVVDKAKRFIREHYAENIGRVEIAEHVLLAPNYLSVLFHKETGMTIREFINSCRVSEAKRLINTSAASVTDIALQTGFDNVSYFSTVFKKYTGMSPNEYKKDIESRG